jgi:hypothetical protein
MAAYAAPMVADPQWRDARVVGHMRRPDGTLRWIVERADGTQHRVVALAVGPDWRTPEPSDDPDVQWPDEPDLPTWARGDRD